LSLTYGRSVVFTGYSSTNKTDRHDINDIKLKVALNTITITPENETGYCNGLFSHLFSSVQTSFLIYYLNYVVIKIKMMCPTLYIYACSIYIYSRGYSFDSLILWKHWVDATAGGPEVPEGNHQPSCKTWLPVWNFWVWVLLSQYFWISTFQLFRI
jgi:hypothetical protein